MNTPPRSTRPWLHKPGVYTGLSLGSALILASSPVAIKEALRSCSPLMLTGVRFVIAGSGLCLGAQFMGLPWPRAAELRRVAILGLLNNAGYVGFTGLSLAYLSAGMSATMSTASSVLLAICAALFLKETLTQRMLAGFTLAAVGVVAVMHARLGVDNRPIGLVLSFAGHATNVVGCVLFKKWAHRTHIVVSYAIQLLFGGLLVTLVALFVEGAGTIHWTRQFLACLAYLVLMVSYGGMLTWFYLLHHGSAARAGAFRFMVPVFGLLQGALVLGEVMSLFDVLGSAAVAAGVYFTQRPTPRKIPLVLTSQGESANF